MGITDSKPILERNKLTMPPYGDWPSDRIEITIYQDGLKYHKRYDGIPRVDIPKRTSFIDAFRVLIDFELDRMNMRKQERKGRGKGATEDQRPTSALH